MDHVGANHAPIDGRIAILGGLPQEAPQPPCELIVLSVANGEKLPETRGAVREVLFRELLAV